MRWTERGAVAGFGPAPRSGRGVGAGGRRRSRLVPGRGPGPRRGSGRAHIARAPGRRARRGRTRRRRTGGGRATPRGAAPPGHSGDARHPARVGLAPSCRGSAAVATTGFLRWPRDGRTWLRLLGSARRGGAAVGSPTLVDPVMRWRARGPRVVVVAALAGCEAGGDLPELPPARAGHYVPGAGDRIRIITFGAAAERGIPGRRRRRHRGSAAGERARGRADRRRAATRADRRITWLRARG